MFTNLYTCTFENNYGMFNKFIGKELQNTDNTYHPECLEQDSVFLYKVLEVTFILRHLTPSPLCQPLYSIYIYEYVYTVVDLYRLYILLS